jgi:tyrosyl-tRNA synthetase
MCGTDQIFNCLVARALQQDYGQEPEVILAMPLLEGLDGVQKMSKSLGNYVGITEPPKEMYGKLMSLPDSLMLKYFQLLTPASETEVEKIKEDLASGALHPRAAKATLAFMLVEQFHDKIAAQGAAEEFDRIFRDREVPSEILEFKLDPDVKLDGPLAYTRWALKKIKEQDKNSKLRDSNSAAQEYLEQGAVTLDGSRIVINKKEDLHQGPSIHDGSIIKIGKRMFVKIKL